VTDLAPTDGAPPDEGLAEPVDPTTPVVADDVEPPVERWLVVLVVAVVGALLAWLVVRLVTSDWLAVGDYRTLQLRVADVGGSETPLVGVYSRYGWNHPGPLLYYLLAAPYRLTGGSDLGMLIGALAINLGAIATALWLGARAGRRALVLTGLFVVLLCIGMNPAGLADPWNPRMVVLPLFAAALAAWRTVFGDRVAALALVLWGSFAVQCHLGSALPVLTLVAIGLLALVVRSVRGPVAGRDRRTLAWALVAGLVVWIPPLVQQLRGADGNMSLILDFLGNPPQATAGPAEGLRIVFRYLSVPGDWVRGAEPVMANYSYDTRGWAVPWALLALVGAAWWAWRRRWRVELAACGVAAALVVAAIVASSRIVGAPVPYLIRWGWAVAAFTWFAVGLVALRQLACTTFGRRHAANLVLVATLLGLVVMVPRGIDLTPLRLSRGWAETIEAVVPPTLAAIEGVDGPVYVPDGAWLDSSAALELVSQAEKRGLDVRRSPNWGFMIGEHRTVEREQAAREVIFVNGLAHLEIDQDPDYTFVTSYDALSPDEQAELEAIIDRHADVDVTGMSPIEARDTRDAAFSVWRDAQFGEAKPDPDLAEYLRLIQSGGLLSVYISNGPPR
jgi:hypothetical protein